MLACQVGYQHVVECLLTAKVNIHLTDASGKSALYHAAEQAIKLPEQNRRYKIFTHIIKLLLKQGAHRLPPASVEIEVLIGKLQIEIINEDKQKAQHEIKSLTTKPEITRRKLLDDIVITSQAFRNDAQHNNKKKKSTRHN